ncbi:MAG: PilT/PilU family type 4a pilus ATPase [bacterium]|nr:PilT/PilU family type 4a pilus ATPase [bacterium]
MQLTEFKLLLSEMLNQEASDLHLKVGAVPMFRIHGSLMPTTYDKLTDKDTADLSDALLTTERLRKIRDERGDVDFAYVAPGLGRFRINIFRQRSCYDIAVRAIKLRIPAMTELNLDPVVTKLANEERGLILVTGTAGCGKSTTLTAMIDTINSSRTCNIITVEDPIEFLHQNKKSIISQREVGTDADSFSRALEHVLRQDPDVIMIGEIRDEETMQVTMAIAETGHLVMATLHTYDAPQTVGRILDFYPPQLQPQIRKQVSQVLQGVICQRLLPTADRKGRLPALEIMVNTPIVRKLITEGKIAEMHQAIQDGELGMQTFNQSLVKLFHAQKIDLETGLLYSDDPAGLRRNIAGGYADSDRRGIIF